MKRLNQRFPYYARLLHFYPEPYRRRYGEEILQTAADMLDHAGSRSERLIIRTRLAFDLPLSITRQQLAYAVGATHSMPDFLKRNSLIAGMLLIPFLLALIANRLFEWMTSSTLYGTWLWRGLAIRTWAFYLPLLALALAFCTYLFFLFDRRSKQSLPKKLSDIIHSWPVLITGVLSFAILFVLIFHDSGQCWLHNPVHLGLYIKHSWQCSVGNQVELHKLFTRAF